MDWRLAIKQERGGVAAHCRVAFCSCRSGRVRLQPSPSCPRLCVWILRRAETVAWGLVMGEHPPASFQVGPAGDSPTDAMRLASSFRALARELDRLARFAVTVEDAELAGLQHFGAHWTPGVDDFLNILRSLEFAPPARHMVCATGPLDTS